LLGIGSISIYILSSVYGKTTVIFGNKYSTALLSLMFITSFVGCTSSVLFMPYMRNYKEMYLVSYLVGEGLSGFLPSIIALIQGIGGNPECVNVTKVGSEFKFETRYPDPRFSSSSFFIFIGSLLFLSFLSFAGLNNIKVAKKEKVKLPASTETLPTDMDTPPSYKNTSGWSMTNQKYYFLLIMMGVTCLLGNGILPSIQSYSCLPYGNLAYHLTVTLASMAGPLAMSTGFFIKNPKVSLLSTIMSINLVLSAIVFYLAVQSPTPPLQNSWFGEFLVVILWILVSGFNGFVKMGITTLFRPDPGRGLYYTGVATQIGSLIGAITTFILVNYTKIFQSYSPCTALINH
jgi:riboflavin transporter 2